MDRCRRFRDWSNLPSELIEDIILNIDWPEDVLRFSSVCRSWLIVFKGVRSKWRPSNPFLLLGENTKDNDKYLRKVYNPGNNMCYTLKLPEIYGKSCWGSDYGWIVTYGLDLQLTLFNPLTKVSLNLPPTTSMMPHELLGRDCCKDCKYRHNWMRANNILKACVLKTNDNNDDEGFLVVVIHAHLRYHSVRSTYLSFAKPGHMRWTLIETPSEMMIHDALFSNDLLWFVNAASRLWYVDLSKEGSSFKAVEFSVERHSLLKYDPIKYLVESRDHQLHLVQRHHITETTPTTTITRKKNGVLIVDDDVCPLNEQLNRDRKSSITYTDYFQIFKLDFSTRKWRFLDDSPSDWGQSSLFLGKNTSILVDDPKVGTCTSRLIYYAGDHQHTCGHDIGVRNVCSNLSPQRMPTEFYDGSDIVSDVCNPFWFTPLIH